MSGITLDDILKLMQQGQQRPPMPSAPDSPGFGARQVAGGGLLGQALSQQGQQLGNAGGPPPMPQGMPPGPPPSMPPQGGPPMGAPPPQAPPQPPMPQVNMPQHWNLQDTPDTMDPVTKAKWMAAHGITQPPSMLEQLLQALKGSGQAQASTPR